jgi:hypothetical protein
MATIEAERSRREAMWASLLASGGPSGLPSGLLRDAGVYGGAQGVWVDTDRTRGINGARGITVSLLHTGRHYADELVGGTGSVRWSRCSAVAPYPWLTQPPAQAAVRRGSEICVVLLAGCLNEPIFADLWLARSPRRRRGWPCRCKGPSAPPAALADRSSRLPTFVFVIRQCPCLTAGFRFSAAPVRPQVPDPVRSRTPLALRSSATRDRIGRAARQGRSITA